MMTLLKAYLLASSKQRSLNSTEGFTIIESLMAIVVVTILLIAIAPPMVISVASRVRARQVELATQAGQGYIDSLRSNAIEAPDKFRCTTPVLPTNTTDACLQPPTAAVLTDPDPGTLVDSNNNLLTSDAEDFVIQAIRTSASADANTDPLARREAAKREGYSLIVRVYRRDASAFTGTPGTMGVEAINTIFTGSTSTGARFRNRPLVVIRTDIGNRSSGTNIRQRVPTGLY